MDPFNLRDSFRQSLKDDKRDPKDAKSDPLVTIAILAKDKAHTLPYFLKCIEKQDYPKKSICIYIRTNNNRDKTIDILNEWALNKGLLYREVFMDTQDVGENVQDYSPHEWNQTRFSVLAKIKGRIGAMGASEKSHYFVIDCDNFIAPNTLTSLVKLNLPVVAPMLTDGACYANFHSKIDPNGYFANDPLYYHYLNREVRGIISMPVVHCTYFIRQQYLSQVSYHDDTSRHEYVIFSHNCRKAGIEQYLDNRMHYGQITFINTSEDLEKRNGWMNIDDRHISMSIDI